MMKAAFRTVCLASAIAMTMAPAFAQASRDVTTSEGAPAVTTQQKVVPLQIAIPAPSTAKTTGNDDSLPRNSGTLQGFGPMQANPFPSAPALQGSPKK